jgi:hypothetical protein
LFRDNTGEGSAVSRKTGLRAKIAYALGFKENWPETWPNDTIDRLVEMKRVSGEDAMILEIAAILNAPVIEEQDKKLEENVAKFIRELNVLSEDYGLVIGGCGCCGSPRVAKMTDKQVSGHYEYDIVDDGLVGLRWKEFDG